MLTILDWRQRYQQQASWTRSLRHYLLNNLAILSNKQVLEVGCGTGAISSELSCSGDSVIYGIDLNFEYLEAAALSDRESRYCCADAHLLPFPDQCFDAVYFHYFLLWIRNIPALLSELKRVIRPEGYLFALAEPDYDAIINYPPSLNELGNLQAAALEKQGANPCAGRQIMADLVHSGLKQVEGGLIGGQWKAEFNQSEFDSEWKILQSDFADTISPAQIESLRRIDEASRRKGERIFFVPTFYAIGKKPKYNQYRNQTQEQL